MQEEQRDARGEVVHYLQYLQLLIRTKESKITDTHIEESGLVMVDKGHQRHDVVVLLQGGFTTSKPR